MKSAAEPFGSDATHAPQPMHAAASIGRSEAGFGTGMALPSIAVPVGAVMKPPDAMMRSNALPSTARSFTTGKAAERQGRLSVLFLGGVYREEGEDVVFDALAHLSKRDVGDVLD